MVGTSEAEEVVQEAFEHALANPRFLEEVEQPAAWLRVAMTRLALTRLRRRERWNRIRALALPAVAPSPDATRVDIYLALEKLPRHQRAAIVLHYYFDASYEEIARALDVSDGSVGPTLSRARATLRRLLQ